MDSAVVDVSDFPPLVVIIKVVAVDFEGVVQNIVELKQEVHKEDAVENVRIEVELNSLRVSAPSLWGLEIGEECCDTNDEDLNKEWDVEDSPLSSAGKPDDVNRENTNYESNGDPEGYDGTNLSEVWGNQNTDEEKGGKSLEPFSSFVMGVLTWNEGEKDAVYQNVHSHEVEHLEELVLALADWIK